MPQGHRATQRRAGCREAGCCPLPLPRGASGHTSFLFPSAGLEDVLFPDPVANGSRCFFLWPFLFLTSLNGQSLKKQ